MVRVGTFWVLLDEKTRNQIDHMLIARKQERLVRLLGVVEELTLYNESERIRANKKSATNLKKTLFKVY